MNLFENITNHDILGGCGESDIKCLNIETGAISYK